MYINILSATKCFYFQLNAYVKLNTGALQPMIFIKIITKADVTVILLNHTLRKFAKFINVPLLLYFIKTMFVNMQWDFYF